METATCVPVGMSSVIHALLSGLPSYMYKGGHQHTCTIGGHHCCGTPLPIIFFVLVVGQESKVSCGVGTLTLFSKALKV